MSPTAVMSATQKAKKSQTHNEDDSPLADWVAEVVETLHRPTGSVKVAREHVSIVREHLLHLLDTDGEVDHQILEELVETLGTNTAICRRLTADAFTLLVEVILVTRESAIRARCLYILAESLRKERSSATNKAAFLRRLGLIGKGCLLKLFDQFTEKSVPYSSRRWMGTLLLELVEDSDDNQGIVAFMSTSKQAKLGTCILYEASEILRSLAGRIMTIMLAAEEPIEHFFPSGTAAKLYNKYPECAQSASQWDKTFQEYVDEIWEDICINNASNGEIQFAQNLSTEPPNPDIHAVLAGRRSIYIELSDSVRIYVHSGTHSFDSAIDIPLISIEGITTSLTLVDRAQPVPTVDVVLAIMPSAPCFVNSLQTSLSALRLTVGDQSIADGIVDCIGGLLHHTMENREAGRQIGASLVAQNDSPESSQQRKSCSDEPLVLDGSYTVVNDSFIEAPVPVVFDHATQDKENLIGHQNRNDEAHVVGQRKGAGPEQQKASSRATEVAVGKRKTAGGGRVTRQSASQESSEPLAGDDPRSPSMPHKDSAAVERQTEIQTALPPAQRKQLKSKAPIRGPKSTKATLVGPEEPHKQNIAISTVQTMEILSLPAPSGAPNRSKVVAPIRDSIKLASKVAQRGFATRLEEDDIYDVSSSPPRTKKSIRVPQKTTKAALPSKSSRMYGGHGKGKSKSNAVLHDSDDHETIVDVDLPLLKVQKHQPKKKGLKTAHFEPAAATAKRTTASRSTKAQKNMKDLSDSEIEELTLQEVGSKEQATIVKSEEKVSKRLTRGHVRDGITKATDLATTIPKASQKAASKSLVSKRNIIGRPIVRQRSTDDEMNDDLGPQDGDETGSAGQKLDPQYPFDDEAVAASIEGGDDLDVSYPPTAEVHNSAGAIEAKIGRKMAEIFGFATTRAQTKIKLQPGNAESPQRTSPTSLRSPLSEVKAAEKVAEPSPITELRPLSGGAAEAAIDNDEHIVLSSPPQLGPEDTEETLLRIARLNAQPSSSTDPIVLPDSDEERSPAAVKSSEKHTLANAIDDNPPKRQRAFKAVSLSSPPRSGAASLSKRGAIKARVQAQKQATPVPKRISHIAADKESESAMTRSPLIDDHQARKAPLISFGPQGPRNQGLSSAVKASRVAEQNELNTLTGILHSLSKQSVSQKPSTTKKPGQVSAGVASREPSTSYFEDSLVNSASVMTLDPGVQEDDGMSFFDAGRSITSSRSHSRVDVNGSPQPKRSVAPVESLPHVVKKLDFASTVISNGRSSHRNTVEKRSTEIAFDDDTTLVGSGRFISSNRKARPAAPQDDLDFQSRYTPHHPADNGSYVGIADQKVIDVAPALVDPFTSKLKRQDSNFARRLRVSGSQPAEREAQLQRPTAFKAQSRIQRSGTALLQPSRPRSLIDTDATLVDTENLSPQRSRKSRRDESSSCTSDSEADAEEGKHEPITPNPQQVWKEALKPHQQDVSDVLQHVVNGLLQKLFDKEPAIQAIAREYRVNGGKIVEGLQSKLDADVQAASTYATSTIEDLVKSLRQSRAALQLSSGGSKELDDQYKAWRARQHALQSLPFMAREHGRK